MTTPANTDLAGAVERVREDLEHAELMERGWDTFEVADLRLILTALASKEDQGSSSAESAARGPSDLMGSTAPCDLDDGAPVGLIRRCHSCGSGDVRWCRISVRPYCAECSTWGVVNFGTPADAVREWNAKLAPSSQTEAPQPVHDEPKSDVPEDVGELVSSLRTGRGLTENVDPEGGVWRDAWVHQTMQQAADLITSQAQKITSLETQEAVNSHFVNEIQRALGDGPDGSNLEVLGEAVEARFAELRDRRADETQGVVAALYKAWPDAEDIASDWPNGIIGGIEQIIAERDNERQRQDGMFPLTERIWRQNVEARDTDLAAMRERLERAESCLREIDEWAQAYPLKVFPEPDFAKVHAALTAAGLSLDAVSASNMRHVISRAGHIARSYFTQGGETS